MDGLIIFGQPMVARSLLTDRIGEFLPGGYVHYVNQSDIVPKTPPSLDHSASLVWSDGEDIRRPKRERLLAAAAPDGERAGHMSFGVEPRPLFDAEFEALQRNLKARL